MMLIIIRLRNRCVQRFAWTVLLALLLPLLTSCEQQVPRPANLPEDVAWNLIHPDLRSALARTLADLAQGTPYPEPVDRTVHQVFVLREDLRLAERKAVAADSLLARWDSAPRALHWIETAWLRARSLPDPDLPARRLERLAADTTDAVAHFAHATMNRRGDVADQLRILQADSLRHQLPTLDQRWLDLALAAFDVQRERAAEAMDRLIAQAPGVWSAGGPALAATWWLHTARACQAQERLADAHAAATVAVMCARAGGHGLQEVWALRALASVQDDAGRPTEAAGHHTAAAIIADQLGYQRLAWSSRGKSMSIHYELEDYRRTLADARHILRLAMSQHDTTRAVAVALQASRCQRHLGRLDSAMVSLTTAQDLQAAAGIHDYDHAVSIMAMQLAIQQGDVARLDSLRSSVQDLPPEARAVFLLNLVEAGIDAGQPALVYRNLEEARGLVPEIPVRETYDPMLDLHLLSARFLAQQGEFIRADEALARATQRLTADRSRFEHWDHAQDSGEVAELAGDLTAAGEHLRAALALAEDLGNPKLVNRSRIRLGRIMLQQGDLRAAEDLFRKAAAAPDHWARLAASVSLGEVMAIAGRHHEALVQLDAAESILAQDSSRILQAILYLARSRSLAATGRHAEALDALRRIDLLTEITDVRERSFRRPLRRDAAEAIIGLLFDHPELADHEDRHQATLTLAETIHQNHEVRPPQPPPPGQVAVAFFLGSQRAFAWTGSHGQWRLRELPGLESLQRDIDAVCFDMGSPHRDVDSAPAHRLTEALLGPALQVWDGEQPLAISAPGRLAELPWAALPVGQNRHLLDVGPLVMRAGWEQPPPRPRSLPGSLLALGTNDAPGVDRLRQAEAEVQAIARQWDHASATVLTGADASWDTVASLPLSQFDVIHVASHAQVFQGLPGRTTLRLGDSPLTLQDVRELSLDADVVYLSCCEGGHQRRGAGAGLDSFASAFMSAGARHVVASDQPVNDEVALALSRSFYAHWLQGQTKPQALRMAQLSVRSHPEWTHPFHWATIKLHMAGMTDGSR